MANVSINPIHNTFTYSGNWILHEVKVDKKYTFHVEIFRQHGTAWADFIDADGRHYPVLNPMGKTSFHGRDKAIDACVEYAELLDLVDLQ